MEAPHTAPLRATNAKAKVRSSNGNLSPDLNDLFVREFEEIAYMRRVALHHSENALLPARQAAAILTSHDGFVTNVIRDVTEIDRAPLSFAVLKKGWNVRALHKSVPCLGAPKLRKQLGHS